MAIYASTLQRIGNAPINLLYRGKNEKNHDFSAEKIRDIVKIEQKRPGEHDEFWDIPEIPGCQATLL